MSCQLEDHPIVERLEREGWPLIGEPCEEEIEVWEDEERFFTDERERGNG